MSTMNALQTAKGRGEVLKAVSLGELLAHAFPPREHLLTPWLRQGESALVWAQAGLGKTMLTLTMALAVAGGGEFLGWGSATPRRVLIVDGEMHSEDLKDRLAMLTQTINGFDPAAAADNLKLLPRTWQRGRNVDFPDIAAREGQDEIIRMAKGHKAELVILDNFATLADVADENEAAAMTPVLTFLLRLKQEGIACILVHHAGKAGSTYRGSPKLATTFEVILGLLPWDDADATAGATFETEWTKYRGARHEGVKSALVVLQEREDGRREWTAQTPEGGILKVLLAEMRAGLYATQKEIATAKEVAGGTVTGWKHKAVAKGLVTERQWQELLDAAKEARHEGDVKAILADPNPMF